MLPQILVMSSIDDALPENVEDTFSPKTSQLRLCVARGDGTIVTIAVPTSNITGSLQLAILERRLDVYSQAGMASKDQNYVLEHTSRRQVLCDPA